MKSYSALIFLGALSISPSDAMTKPSYAVLDENKPKFYPKDYESLGVRYLDHVEFEDDVTEKKVKEITALMQKHEVFSLPEKYEKEIEQKYQINTCIQLLNEKIGYGAFTQEDVACDQLIAEYAGIIRNISNKQISKEDAAYGWSYTPTCLHIVVDAKTAGNFTRFVNHSRYPNVSIECIIHNGIAHTIYVAKKHIPEGAQLLVNYGESYWENRGQLPMQLGNPTEEEICEAEEDDCHHEKLEALLRVMTTLESPELIGLK